MSEGEAGSRHVRTASAVLLLVVTPALLCGWCLEVVSRPFGAQATQAESPDLRHARLHSAGLQSLARCHACHASDDAPGNSRLVLASAATVALNRHQPTPHGDRARVRAGGAVYARACASCHTSEDDAVGTPTPWRLAGDGDDSRSALHGGRANDNPFRDDRATAATVNSLSDDQIAALAAFLQRHADVVALPWRERRRQSL